MVILAGILMAVLTGIIASLAFMLLLYFMRPRVHISTEIAKGKNPEDGRIRYRIKVVNQTRFPLIDVRAQLHRFTPHVVKEDRYWMSKSIELNRSDPLCIAKYSRKDADGLYAFHFATYEDIDSIWNSENQKLVFRVYCRNALTGTGALFKHEFLSKSTIKHGDFAAKESMAIEVNVKIGDVVQKISKIG